jgi:hypothetical protein
MTDVNDLIAQYPIKGRALVVGSKQYKGKADRRSLYEDAIGLDMSAGEGVDIVHNLEIPLPDDVGKFGHIDCVSVLEHVERPWLLCANIESAMESGATILLSVPFIWRVHAYPSDYWRFTAESLSVLFPSVKWLCRYYLCGKEICRKPPAETIGGNVYMMKTEVIAFGVACSTAS